MATTVIQARSKLGVASRSGDPDLVADARRNLAAAKIKQYIEKTVSEAPPLTDDQRQSLTALLASSELRGDANAAA